MQLNEFINIDHPSDKLIVGYDTIEEMIKRKEELDTRAFLYVYKSTIDNLPRIATERALTRDWDQHPMFGINSLKCSDQRAKEYQTASALADRIFAILLERATGI